MPYRLYFSAAEFDAHWLGCYSVVVEADRLLKSSDAISFREPSIDSFSTARLYSLLLKIAIYIYLSRSRMLIDMWKSARRHYT